MGTRRGTMAAAVLWLFAGLVIWAIGVFGIARGLEDRCLRVADERGYGASSTSASVWPPRFTCELDAANGTSGEQTVEVSQPAVALLRSGWTIGFPVAWLALGTGIRLRQSARDRFLEPR